VAQHQRQCSIFANHHPKVCNIFLCSCCFRLIATWLTFRCWPTLINPFTDCFQFTEQSFLPFSGNFATIVWYPKPSFRYVSIRALSSYSILPITKVIGLIAIMTWNIEEFITNQKIMTSQKDGTCCSVTFIIKSTFCSVVKFVLEVCVSVNLTYVK